MVQGSLTASLLLLAACEPPSTWRELRGPDGTERYDVRWFAQCEEGTLASRCGQLAEKYFAVGDLVNAEKYGRIGCDDQGDAGSCSVLAEIAEKQGDKSAAAKYGSMAEHLGARSSGSSRSSDGDSDSDTASNDSATSQGSTASGSIGDAISQAQKDLQRSAEERQRLIDQGFGKSGAAPGGGSSAATGGGSSGAAKARGSKANGVECMGDSECQSGNCKSVPHLAYGGRCAP